MDRFMVEPEGLRLFHTLAPIIGLAVFIALGVILMVYQFQRSLFRRRINEENLKINHQRELLRTTIAVQEQERQRIAGDLHDELGSRLSITLMLLRQCSTMPAETKNSFSTLLVQVEDHIKQALSATKRISYELMPPQLVNLGLYQALLVLVEDMRQAGKISIVMNKVEIGIELAWPIQLGIYRMLSELLNNTLKHAGATKVNVELKIEDEYLVCYYSDNGRGLPKSPKGEGLGLQSLEGRSSALNGTLEWGNISEGGFFTKIILPINS